MMKPPISLVLATAESCQLGCKGCPTGRTNLGWGDEKPKVGLMSTELATRIVQKAKREAQVLSVCLYYFNEPFLLPNLLELVAMFKREKLYCFLSTNLSFDPDHPAFPKKLEGLMALAPDNIIVSLSGLSQETYGRYHQKGQVEWVKKNLVTMAKLRSPGTFLRMSWHDFRYNRHERPAAEALARANGYYFTSYGVGVLPLERTLARWKDGQPDPAEADILVPLQAAKQLSWPRRHWNCQMQQQTMTVDAAGNVYNCSDRYNAGNTRGSFFAQTVSQILAARKTDFDCVQCKAVGGHIYGAQEYTVPLWSVKRWLDIPFRKFRLQGAFQKLAPRWWRRSMEGYYTRPQEDGLKLW